MAYSDNFGQIMLQGHQAREARRQAGEIAQLRYGNRGNNNSARGSAGDNDELQWLKAGQELAKQEAQMRVLGEQQAEQIRQRQIKLMAEYDDAKRDADRKNKIFDARAFFMSRGYFMDQIDPSSTYTWGQSFSEGTGGIINEQGHGVKYTIGSEHDDTVKDQVILALNNAGFNIDYGVEETTMNLGTDDNLTTKEKFQKFGEQVKGAFTPGAKTNKPLGESHGVTEGENTATPGNTENQTKFEEGEYASAPEATNSFTLAQLDEAFKNKDFSSFPPKAQKVIRNYIANTYVGYDKQGTPTVFNIAEAMDYLTAKQANDAKQQEAAAENLNKSFPALANNFDEQRSMFPGAIDDINSEQQQYNNALQHQQMLEKQALESAISSSPEAKTLRNENAMRDLTYNNIERANKIVNSPNTTERQKANAMGLIGNNMKDGRGENFSYHAPQIIKDSGAGSKDKEPKQSIYHKLGADSNSNIKLKALAEKLNIPETSSVKATAEAVIERGSLEDIQELINIIDSAKDPTTGLNLMDGQSKAAVEAIKTAKANTAVAQALKAYDEAYQNANDEAHSNALIALFNSVGVKMPGNLQTKISKLDRATAMSAATALRNIYGQGYIDQKSRQTLLSIGFNGRALKDLTNNLATQASEAMRIHLNNESDTLLPLKELAITRANRLQNQKDIDAVIKFEGAKNYGGWFSKFESKDIEAIQYSKNGEVSYTIGGKVYWLNPQTNTIEEI